MRWLICLVVLVISVVCQGAISSPLVLSGSADQVNLSDKFAVLRDPDGLLGLDDVAAPTLNSTFTKGGRDLNFGLTKDTIWMRVDVQRAAGAPTEWWLEVAPAYIGEVTVYVIGPNRGGGLVKASTSGSLVPLSSREFKTRHSTFRINMQEFQPYTIYLRLRSNTSIGVRASLWQPLRYTKESASENLLLGAYYGAFLLIFSLCVVQWMLKGSQTDFWWMIYLAAEWLLVFRMNGLASRYLFSELPILDGSAWTISLSVMVWAGARFGIHAFALDRKKNRKSLMAAHWIGNLALVTGLIRLFDASVEATAVIFFLALALCLLNCILSWRFVRTGHAAAIFYFVGVWFMSCCVVLVLARNFGLIPAYQFVDYIWQSNLLIHAGLMSMGVVLTHQEVLKEKTRLDGYRASADASLNLSLMQKRMVSLVSHEFRNALAMASVLMRAISKSEGMPPEVNERHQKLAKVHHQMRRVIDDFLLEERIKNAEVKVSYRKTDVHALIDDVVSTARLLGQSHSVSADFSRIPQFLWMDGSVLRLTLTNLLDNSVKYSPAGSKVDLTGFYENDILNMSVVDSGIGMTPRSLSQIFQPHFKVDQQSDGMGIGLYMVKMMLDAHDGGIKVISAIEKGTTVHFWLKSLCHEEERFEKM